MRVVESRNRRAVTSLLSPERIRDAATDRAVARIVDDVRRNGDRALRRYARQFDRLEGPIEAGVDAMRAAGFDPAAAAQAARNPAGISAYLELHIEQGRVLEQEGLPLGIVTAIVGQERLTIRFVGQSDHAGTAPMALRRDAFTAAARFADRFRDLLLADVSKTLRGTIGIVNVSPNQGNVVPSEVRLGLEIRDIDEAAVERTARATEKLAAEVAGQFGCEVKCRSVYRDAPVPMDGGLRAARAEIVR